MSHCKFFAAIALMLCTSPGVAAELKASDIEVVAVIPRSPDVKPYVMPVRGDGHKPALQTRKEQEASAAEANIAKAAVAVASTSPDRNTPLPAAGNEN